MKKSILTLITTLPLFSFGQTAGSSNYDISGLVGLIIGIIVCLVIFLALRQLVLWYWKVETIITNQSKQIKMLESIYNSIEENNRLAQTQIELVIGRDNEIDS